MPALMSCRVETNRSPGSCSYMESVQLAFSSYVPLTDFSPLLTRILRRLFLQTKVDLLFSHWRICICCLSPEPLRAHDHARSQLPCMCLPLGPPQYNDRNGKLTPDQAPRLENTAGSKEKFSD